MSDIKRLDAGPRMSGVVIHGDHIHFAGFVAENAPGGSVTEQTRDILAKIDRMLAQAGSDKTKLIEATIWLSDISTFNEMNAVWDAWVVAGQAPTRACVESKLANPNYAVEIRVLAAR